MDEPKQIENWIHIAVLGSGAFGVVTLWKNSVTSDCIAIKKCKWKLKSHITAKQRLRWVNEVQIMKEIKNPNIVAFKALPDVLETTLSKYNPTKLPLLSMEYCAKGNLRHCLNQARNSNGLVEDEVRLVLENISNAVSYLHSKNITHRDIKPDNIVLQEDSSNKLGIRYKLIDLGYAKELNDSVVSFVGTLHYLAPEIIKTETYNYSVDYWSFGILAFEIICGVLPFLPQLTPFERHEYIEKKLPEHICIYQLHSGGIMNSSELLKENYISSCLKQNIEAWLKHVLQFDPSERSKNFPDNTDVFQNLNNVLKKKVVQLFCVHTLEFYSYEIKESTLVGTLKDWIARDTKILKQEQVLLTKSKSAGADDQFIADLVEGNSFIYVLKKGDFIDRTTCDLPKYVKVLFENCTVKYKWADLRPIYSKCSFFLRRQDELMLELSTAFDLFVNYVFHFTTENLERASKEINKILSHTLIKLQCYFNIRKSFSNGQKIKSEEYKLCLRRSLRLLSSLERCILNLKKLDKKVLAFKKRCTTLKAYLPKIKRLLEDCKIKKYVDEATALLVKGSSIIPEKAGTATTEFSSKDMCQLVSKAIKDKDKLLNSERFQSFSRATSVTLKDADILLSWMDEFKRHISEISSTIDDNERQSYEIFLSSSSYQRRNDNNDIISYATNDAKMLLTENQNLRHEYFRNGSRYLIKVDDDSIGIKLGLFMAIYMSALVLVLHIQMLRLFIFISPCICRLHS